jgi:Uma2 family endonuclease
MSEDEFVKWSSVERRGEWINGTVIPLEDVFLDHAELDTFLTCLLGRFIEDMDLGHLLRMPFQLRLGDQKRRRLPDLFFASNSKSRFLQQTEFNGPPDLIVEIVSAASQSRDRREKFLEYEQAEATEYWLVDSVCRTFEMYTLDADRRFRLVEPIGKSLYSIALPGFLFRSEWITAPTLPKVSDLLRLMSRNRKKLLSTRKGRKSDNQS